jgi:hypothetical protein
MQMRRAWLVCDGFPGTPYLSALNKAAALRVAELGTGGCGAPLHVVQSIAP